MDSNADTPAGNRNHTLLVVGAGEVTDALEAMARLLDWTPIVVDSAEDAERALPQADSVVVTSHHDGTDGPALAAALAAGKRYVGGMGSRTTQARRREWMLAHGVPQDQVDSVRGPAGLDIGADGPVEIAVSILAEVIGTFRGGRAGSISDRSGPIHPTMEPGTAHCPGG